MNSYSSIRPRSASARGSATPHPRQPPEQPQVRERARQRHAAHPQAFAGLLVEASNGPAELAAHKASIQSTSRSVVAVFLDVL